MYNGTTIFRQFIENLSSRCIENRGRTLLPKPKAKQSKANFAFGPFFPKAKQSKAKLQFSKPEAKQSKAKQTLLFDLFFQKQSKAKQSEKAKQSKANRNFLKKFQVPNLENFQF